MHREHDTFSVAQEFIDTDVVLVTQRPDGFINAMTVGWKTLGILWSQKVVIVAVRHDRYTFDILETEGAVRQFTVSVLQDDYAKALEVCGSKSGRRASKLEEAGLTTVPSLKVAVPTLAQAKFTFECDIIHTAESGDISNHRLYFGKIRALTIMDH